MNKEDYNKFYIQGSDHYLIPKDIFDELFNEMYNWREEAKELKKQLEEYKRLGFKHLNDQNNKLKEVIKEARECIEKEFDEYSEFVFGIELKNKILEILSKGEKE